MPIQPQPQPETDNRLGAVVLCGGQSKRMGYDKFRLPFGDKTFLECVVEKLLGQIDGPIVASANTETLEEVRGIVDGISSERVSIAIDQKTDCGPIEGIRCGLQALSNHVPWAFVTSCDVPLIRPGIVSVLQEVLLELSDGSQPCDAVVPQHGSRIYGMTALYRTSIIATIEQMIDQGSLRVSDLSKAVSARMIDVQDLRSADPDLESMMNLNSPGQYFELIRSAGLECPPNILERLAKPND